MIRHLFYTEEKLAMKPFLFLFLKKAIFFSENSKPCAASAWRARSARAARRRARAASDSDLSELFNLLVRENMNHFKISLFIDI